MAEPGEEEGGKPAPAESESGGKKDVEDVEATDNAPSKIPDSSAKGTASGSSPSASTEGVSSAGGSKDVVADKGGEETVNDDASVTKGESKPDVEEQIVDDAEEKDMEDKGQGKAAESERLSDNESYHSPGEEEYKSESDDASGLLRGRRREASDEEDEEDEEEDGFSVADEEAQQARGGTSSEANLRGEGAYESDGLQTVEKTDGDADDEGDDLLDDDSNDLDADEGKVDEDAPPHGEEQVAAPRAEVKKPAEPFVVPTAGPFYMHDDRFGGEETKRPGKGKKLWDGSADISDRWPHDMFEKLNLANDAPPVRRGDGERRRGGGGYGRVGRGESAAYGGTRGGRGGGRGSGNGPEGGRRNFVAMQSAPGGQPQSDPALLPTPQYNLELLQEFPPPQSAQSWGGQPAASRQATVNGTSDFSNNRDQGSKGGGQNVRGNVSRGQKAVPAWADSEPGAATGWGDEVQEMGPVTTNRGRGGRSAGDGQALGRGAGTGRGEYKPRTPPRSGPGTGGNNPSAARRRGPTGWGPAAGGQQPVDIQGSQAGYNRGGGQPTGWDSRSPAGNQERAPGTSQGRSATVGTMTSPRSLEQTPSREEKRQQYQPPPESRPAAQREIEVQTDLAPEVSAGSRNVATTPRGGGAKSGPPPGFAGSSGGAPYGSSGSGGGEYGVQYRAPASAGTTGRSSPGLHLASEYVPNSATQQVLPYGQSAVPPVGGYSLPPYPSHLPPYAYGSSEVTWVPVLNNPQANALPPPPNVYGTNPYASPYSLGGAEASPYVYSSQAVAPPEYAPAKQGLGTNAAISRPPSASTLWRPPASAGLSTGALDSNADAYGQRQSKPRRYTEMTFQ